MWQEHQRNLISGLINGILINTMKTNRSIILLILLLSLNFSASLSGYSQEISSKEVLLSGNYLESLVIITDRDLYITGEQVWCKISKMNGFADAPADYSRLIYLELLDEFNIPVVQIKIWADGTSGTAHFRIPDTFSSGNFVLRAYTSWMKNFNADQFAYKTLTIVNPFKGADRLLFTAPVIETVEDTVNNGRGPMVTGIFTDPDVDSKGSVKVETDKNKYNLREKVRLTISQSDGSPIENPEYFSVTVVKSFLEYKDRDKTIFNHNINDIQVPGGKDLLFLPEPEGEIIRGVIRNKEDGEPLRNIGISLSFVGKNPVCQFGTTDQNGEFIFVIKRLFGLNELVIQPLVHSGSASSVELVQPFSSMFSSNKPENFLPDTSLVNDINKAVIAMQVTAIYEPFRGNLKVIPPLREKVDFFGKPTRRVILSDYIELTDTREVVKEILTEVSVNKSNKEVIMKVLSKNPYEEFKNQALILIDGIPFYDIEKLLKIKGSEIEHVDIINTRYFYSGYIFEGIVSFVTKKGNLSALEFDDNVYRRVFEGCQQPAVFYSPDYSIDTLKHSRIPDFRNTLYWNPSLQAGKDLTCSAEFYTSDEPGDYIIVVEGMDEKGKPVYSTASLRVN